ncbi:TetR/AcrR family transcriptional regulator [Actinoplanes sp. NPDC051475]|uniref:TetR/AcrR family transcriptional regulator n=1 Tax=Actinoplanes sp. NPDC051475 TaxID=3157225 RepID=UPI00344D9508
MTQIADGRLARGDRTRAAALDSAIALATEAGLDGLTLGQLADRLGVSKSGLFAHWRSKEELQLATIERARESFKERVVAAAMDRPAGVGRLWKLHEARLEYIADDRLPGGCFFVNAQFEYDAKTGPVRERLAEVLAEWLALIERLATEAVDAGELAADVDVSQLAFEINAVGAATVYQSRLLPDSAVMSLARTAVLARLRSACTDPELLPRS